MTDGTVGDVRKTFEAALEKLTPAKAQKLARSLLEGDGASKGKEQVSKLAHELMEWSQRNRERMVELVRREVRDQLKSLGVASRDEVEALRKRVRALEKAASAVPKRSPAKRSSSRTSGAKPASGGSAGGGSA